jgi:GAF domain-containing protein
MTTTSSLSASASPAGRSSIASRCSNQAHPDPRVELVPGTPLEPEALIVVPLIARGALKGTLNVYRRRARRSRSRPSTR